MRPLFLISRLTRDVGAQKYGTKQTEKRKRKSGGKKTAVRTSGSADRSAESASVQFVFHSRPDTSYYTRLNNNKKTKPKGLISDHYEC